MDMSKTPITEESIEALERKNRRLVGRIVKIFLLSLVLYFSYQIGVDQGRNELSASPDDRSFSPTEAMFSNTDSKDANIDFSLFWKVWDILKDKYVDRSNLDAKELFYGAIDGMLAATGDPYTTFFDPKEQKEFTEDISGKFEGIGAEMGLRDEILMIIAPLDGTPAERAGLRPNDKVLKIDGEPSTGYTLEEAVSKIRGPKGTEVKLTIYRSGEEESREIFVFRDVINVKSVKLTLRDDGIAILRVSRFGDDTEREFRDAVSEIVRVGSKGLVLDLRSNPGGLLDAAVDMASAMLPFGKVVVIEENGKGERREEKARGGDRLSGVSTVILIDEGSASASEILAGALRENRDNVTLIGKKSYGKGSVQELISVGKTMAVKITVARWLTPQGHQINEQGISPDEEVGITIDDITNDRDPQMDKAIERLTIKKE
jgi:carboxyl-terminal processing protease